MNMKMTYSHTTVSYMILKYDLIISYSVWYAWMLLID